MYKLTVILCLLLVSCSSNSMTQENNVLEEEQQVVNQTLAFGYQGYIGKQEVIMQYHQADDTVFGKYELNGLEIVFRGEHHGDVSYIYTEKNEKMLLIPSEDTVYGVFLSDEPLAVYATKAVLKPVLSEAVQSFSGSYTSYDSTYYQQTIIKVTPLFDHLMYLEVFKGNEVLGFLALKNERYFELMTTDVSFEITDERELVFNKPLITENETYDIRFSESIEIGSPSLLSLGLVEDELEEIFISELLDEYYDLFILNSEIINYKLYNGYNQYSLSNREGEVSIILYEKNKKYFIWFDNKLIGKDRDRVITNCLTGLPSFLNGEVIIKAKLTNGYSVNLDGDLAAFIPNGFLIKDKITGYINSDDMEDIVLVLDHETIKETRVLAVLLRDGQSYTLDLLSDQAILNQVGGGVFGEPFENIELVDHKLIIDLYGGSNIRWAQTHTFDTLFDYRLVKSELTSHDLASGNIIRVSYDFVENNVIVSNSDDIYKKKLPESIYLMQFNGEELFDTDYQ